MTQQDYETKKRECWIECAFGDCNLGDASTPVTVIDTCKQVFDWAFDRAYALGKKKEAVTQEEIEKAAKKYDSEHAYYNSNDVIECFVEGANFALGKQEKNAEEILTCDKRKVLYHFGMAEACKTGNNPESEYWIGYSKAIQDLFGLEGKPYVTPVDADTVTIDKEEYDKLCKYRRYAANWYWDFTTCPECGEFNPRGCICANCDNDKNWNK